MEIRFLAPPTSFWENHSIGIIYAILLLQHQTKVCYCYATRKGKQRTKVSTNFTGLLSFFLFFPFLLLYFFIEWFTGQLLHHILSFLDAKIAIQTSVLASRWQYLWISLPFINFRHEQFSRYDNPECGHVLRSVVAFDNFVRQYLWR